MIPLVPLDKWKKISIINNYNAATLSYFIIMINNELSKTILNKLDDISTKKDKRVDNYITGLREVLKENTENWNDRHDLVFNEMVKEVRTSRLIGFISSIGVFVSICFIFIYIFILVPNQRKNLVENIKEANIPIKFVPSNNLKNQLRVEYDVSDLKGNQLEFLNKLNLDKLGIYTGLGEDALLYLEKSKEPLEWLVTPMGRKNEVIGKIKVAKDIGSLDRLNSMKINDSISHNNLSEVYLMYSKAPSGKWTEHTEENPNDYNFQYGIKENGKIIWNDPIIVKSSLGGKILRGPFLLSHNEWENIYIVNIAAGNYGSLETDTGLIPIVYNITSKVQKINFK